MHSFSRKERHYFIQGNNWLRIAHLSVLLLLLLGTNGSEDVALYVGLIAVAVCLVLLLLVVTLVYCRKKEGLDSDVADSSILTAGFQPVSIKPTKAGEHHANFGACRGFWESFALSASSLPGAIVSCQVSMWGRCLSLLQLQNG